MAIPTVRIDGSGTLSPADGGTATMLQQRPGDYKVLDAGGLLILTPDIGSGAGPRDDEFVAVAGDLKAMPLLGLLNMLGQNRETGRLVIRHDQIERVIMLRDGDVSSVGSNAPADRLGQFLVRMGKITEAQLQSAVAEAGSSGGRLGQALVTSGLLDAHDLWGTIQGQITEIFADVVNWENGAFVLYRCETEYRFPSTPPLSMQGLLLEAVRRADEMSKYREKVPDFNAVIRKTGKLLPDGKDIEEIMRTSLAAFEGEIRISDLARLVHVSEFDATRCAYSMLKKKVVELVEEVVEEASEPFSLTPEDAAKLEVYNLAYREIRDEVVRNGQLEGFMQGIMKYLTDANAPHHLLFKGIVPDPGGALDVGRLVDNLGNKVQAPDPWAFLQEALNELTFFMLFQCGELLDAQNDENLGRRVRLIHSALSGNSAL